MTAALAWLFGTRPGRIVLYILGALTAGGALMIAKAAYDSRRRREGAARLRAQIEAQTDEIRTDLRDAPKPANENEAIDRLRDPASRF